MTNRPSGVALAQLRGATAADHESVDSLVDPGRLVDFGYYAAVVNGLIQAAEIIETTLPLIPPGLRAAGLSPGEVSKRTAIDAELTFLHELAGCGEIRRPTGPVGPLPVSEAPSEATMLGILYVYVGSGLGGLHLLRFVRTAPWWRPEREHVLFRPYGTNLKHRWRAVVDALERLDPDEGRTAVVAARAGFSLHRRALVEHLSIGVGR